MAYLQPFKAILLNATAVACSTVQKHFKQLSSTHIVGVQATDGASGGGDRQHQGRRKEGSHWSGRTHFQNIGPALSTESQAFVLERKQPAVAMPWINFTLCLLALPELATPQPPSGRKPTRSHRCLACRLSFFALCYECQAYCSRSLAAP